MCIEMKKILFAVTAVSIIAVSCVVCLRNHSNAIFEENVEALSDGEIEVSGCLGLWGVCTLPDGTQSMAPAVHVS